MKWNVFKIIQVLCWIATVTLLVLGLVRPGLFEKTRDIYLGLLGALSVAVIALSTYIEQRIEKFSAANVLAIGYIKNFIEPLMKGQFVMNSTQGIPVKDVYVFIPSRLQDVYNATVPSALAQVNFQKTTATITVSFHNRPFMNIDELTRPGAKKSCLFNIPNTLTSLEALIDHIHRNKTPAEKALLEKKYILAFRRETEKYLNSLDLEKNVKLIDAITDLP